MGIEIKAAIKTSLLDWDGKIVTTVYVPGCNFRCPFCHNWELVEGAKDRESIPLEAILGYMEENVDFIDGVCITGGEPTLYDDLPEFIGRFRGMGFLVKLDTNGTRPDMLRRLIDQGLVDYVAMDVKAPLDDRYERVVGTGVDLIKVRESIDVIRGSGVDHEFRTTVVPGLLGREDILEIAKELEGARRYVLQQFVAENCHSEELRSRKPYPQEEIQKMIYEGNGYVGRMLCRGV